MDCRKTEKTWKSELFSVLNKRKKSPQVNKYMRAGINYFIYASSASSLTLPIYSESFDKVV